MNAVFEAVRKLINEKERSDLLRKIDIRLRFNGITISFIEVRIW